MHAAAPLLHRLTAVAVQACGALIGFLIGAYLADAIGRKWGIAGRVRDGAGAAGTRCRIRLANIRDDADELMICPQL
jgi:hypothetical protein